MFLEIENEVYALNLDRIISFIAQPNKNDKNIESTQSLIYENDENDEAKMKLVSKQLTENKNNDNDSYIMATKYDLTKELLQVIMGIGIKTNPFGEVVEQETISNGELSNISIGEAVAFNTFLNEGFLINVKTN